ncbi:FitA-like ribbon-helix-helix domain-containing protein [Caulobacter mirabilis]|uniref:Plasmid stabilization protein n=1 Tax=Caulobacter mirabilis TaxID=69666 RepID=A0A2D2AWH1_9CAUL|nr:plasmid stabilization protein [Caulobacter mirabilis]ATQ42346.1 plasmid stabilization protein [Caulobacter mirabilis]
MPTLTIRNISESAHDALRRRAAENRRSMEAEARLLIETLDAAPAQDIDWERLRALQARAIAAVGGPEAAKGVVDEFLANRLKDWGEE